MNFGSLFAGIGGFDLGFERAGMECAWQVEIDDYCNRVLAKHWPHVARYRDVRECGEYNLSPVDVICGGFPCQPFSVAGKRGGKADDRYLWPEMLRIIAELRPTWAVGENVAGINGMVLDEILSDLAGVGYTAIRIGIPAAGVGTWHKRLRTFILAHIDDPRQPQSQGDLEKLGRRTGDIHSPDVADADGNRQQADHGRRVVYHENGDGAGQVWEAQQQPWTDCNAAMLSDIKIARLAHWRQAGTPQGENETNRGVALTRPERCSGSWWAVEPGVGRMVYGVSSRMERRKRRKRIEGLGNAVVPQVAEVLGRMILRVEGM